MTEEQPAPKPDLLPDGKKPTAGNIERWLNAERARFFSQVSLTLAKNQQAAGLAAQDGAYEGSFMIPGSKDSPTPHYNYAVFIRGKLYTASLVTHEDIVTMARSLGMVFPDEVFNLLESELEKPKLFVP